MTTTLHEDPETDYERMLDRMDLDCSLAGCWQPIVAYCDLGYGETGLCLKHVLRSAVTRWLEQ